MLCRKSVLEEKGEGTATTSLHRINNSSNWRDIQTQTELNPARDKKESQRPLVKDAGHFFKTL
jgi:hypothetical protein